MNIESLFSKLVDIVTTVVFTWSVPGVPATKKHTKLKKERKTKKEKEKKKHNFKKILGLSRE